MNQSPAFMRLVRLLLWLAGARGGNVLSIVALDLPALLLLIGGGIDMSRSYTARTSLQNACDAGVLAGRRAMSKSGVFSTAETAKAQSMCNFKFTGGQVQGREHQFYAGG
ncbi:pilus assembly protein TadG-related protein [Novosphingobium aquae]|uniref:Pilus assembly protein TadG-related protein n=1 Tax=Novosphingobium aquae TaxID=3133435 RepID=A0ABU8S6H5_9SPHN